MLKIYHVRGTRSVRPIWLCYELELEFEITPIDFSPTFRDSEQWRAISPAGKVPAMTDGDMTMFESGAMVDYILERYSEGRLHPVRGTVQSAIHHQWCWFGEATLSRPLGINALLRATGEGRDELVTDGLIKARTCLVVVNRAVSDRDFLLRRRVWRGRRHDGLFLGVGGRTRNSRQSISKRIGLPGAPEAP